MDERQGHVDLRVQKTKAAIRGAFQAMICEMPAEKITVKELAGRARIHRKTFYLHYPSIEALYQELMEEIVRVHFPDVEEHLLKNAMEVFYDIRSIRDIRKKPSTSELIDWVNALQIGGISADTIRSALPFVGVVVKKDEDLEIVRHSGV